MSEIRSMPPNSNYRFNWDRVFGKGKKKCTAGTLEAGISFMGTYWTVRHHGAPAPSYDTKEEAQRELDRLRMECNE